MPLTLDDFAGGPMREAEFVTLRRQRGGSESHLQGILADMRDSGDMTPKSPPALLH